jgi:hypothetical protein
VEPPKRNDAGFHLPNRKPANVFVTCIDGAMVLREIHIFAWPPSQRSHDGAAERLRRAPRH